MRTARRSSTRSGNVVWFHADPAGPDLGGLPRADLQRAAGPDVVAGTGLGGLSSGTDYIYNDQYQPIATVNAGNGLSADGHEFLITPWNTALILSYTTATANLTSIGGPADQTVINGVVQEIDIATGKVLFQWNSADHVPYSQSEQPLPASASTPWDWFHINAVKLDTDGNLLIDARDTWTTYKVSLATGNIIWQLGGKDSSFALKAAPGQVLDSAGEIFAWQHDPEALGDNVYTFFDNESSGVPLLSYSRAITVKLNERRKIATLVASEDQPEGLSAASQGNAQTTAAQSRGRLGGAAVLLGVLAVRQAALQRGVPGRGEQLPGVPVPLVRRSHPRLRPLGDRRRRPASGDDERSVVAGARTHGPPLGSGAGAPAGAVRMA